MNRMMLLGTGTCQLETARRASSVLLEIDGLRLVYDLGRGIADRLASLGLKQDDVEHVFISHFHPDHISDLVPYLHAGAWSQTDPRSRDLHLYGPPGLKKVVHGLLDVFGPTALGRDSWSLHLTEVAGARVEIGGLELEVAHLPPAGNRGLATRVGGRRLALTGDSSFHAEEVTFLRGADLAVFDSGHLTDDEIVELAAESDARLLVCSHVYRPLDLPLLQSRAEQRGYSGKLLMGADLMAFDLSTFQPLPDLEPSDALR